MKASEKREHFLLVGDPVYNVECEVCGNAWESDAQDISIRCPKSNTVAHSHRGARARLAWLQRRDAGEACDG